MSTRLGYRPALDGVRALAVAAVFLLHAQVSWAEGGFIGVDVFFVLSGLLITTLLLDEHATTGTVSLRDFYLRRWRRLMPALVVCSVVVAVVFVALGDRVTMWGAVAGDTYTAGWVRAFDYSDLGWMGHTWSLSVEEVFYLAWPAIVLAGRCRPRWILGASLTVIAYGTFVPPLAGWSIERSYYAPDTRARDILVGCALAAALRLWPGFGRRWAAWPAAIATAFLVAWTVLARWDGRWRELGSLAVLGASAAVLLYVWHAEPPWLGRLAWVGRRSYGIYLWHFPVLGVLAETGHETGLLSTVAAGVVTLAIAAASYRWVEEPFRHRAPAGRQAVPS